MSSVGISNRHCKGVKSEKLKTVSEIVVSMRRRANTPPGKVTVRNRDGRPGRGSRTSQSEWPVLAGGFPSPYQPKNNAGDRKTADEVANGLYLPLSQCVVISDRRAVRRSFKAHCALCFNKESYGGVVVTVQRSAILGFGFMWQTAYW
ncbi:hypothetical protein QTP88_008096 [Uroleucon formosanum]